MQYPAPLIGEPNIDPVDELTMCEISIRQAGWWQRAGLAEHWPLTTGDADQLLAVGGEFDLDPAPLEDLIDRRLLPSPARGDSGELEWSAADIIQAGGILEMRQQWRPTPSGHDPKKNGCLLYLEQAREVGEVEAIARGPGGNVPRFDCRHLLVLLEQCDSREARCKMVTLLRAVLEVDHGVVI